MEDTDRTTPTDSEVTPMNAAPAQESTESIPAILDGEAYARTAAIRGEMDVDHTPHYQFDAYFAAGKTLWSLPRVRVYRDRLLRLPEYDIRHLDHIEDYARGLRHVQTEILLLIQRARQLPDVAAEGWRVRSMMMSYAETLSHKGHFAPELVVKLREGSGYRDLVEDLNMLVLQFQRMPESRIGLETPVTKADLNLASQIAHRINVHVGNAPDPDVSQEALLIERRKLGALLLRAHGQLRRGVGFFRWDEADVTAILPSLYVPSGPRKPPPEGSTDAPPPDLAALHEQLHAAEVQSVPPLDPEDNPFTE
jgi:hypothetical protein